MQNTYYRYPNITVDSKEVQVAFGLSKFDYWQDSDGISDKFKAKLRDTDIPKECVTLHRLKNSGVLHEVFTMIEYHDNKIKDSLYNYYRKENNEYYIGPHKDGNNVRKGFNRHAASLVIPLKGIDENGNYSKVEWFANHPDQIEVNHETGTWCTNYEILTEKVDEAYMKLNQPIILRTDVWHNVRFSSPYRLLMRWLFKPEVSWEESLNYFN